MYRLQQNPWLQVSELPLARGMASSEAAAAVESQLWERITRVFAAAVTSGAARQIETGLDTMHDELSNTSFLVRTSKALQAKAKVPVAALPKCDFQGATCSTFQVEISVRSPRQIFIFVISKKKSGSE